MGDSNSLNKVCLERLDLDFRSKAPRFLDVFEDFLRLHREKIGLPDTDDLITESLNHFWPRGVKSTLIITKLAPEDGKTYWIIRPFISDEDLNMANRESRIESGCPIPSFKVEEYGGHLIVQSFDPDFHRPPGPYDCVIEANVFINALRGQMGENDLSHIRSIPHYARSTNSRILQWQDYLDWREKVTEENGKHRYAYKEWELRKNNTEVRFYLSVPQPLDLLKTRLQGQQLMAQLVNKQAPESGSPTGSNSRKRMAKTPNSGVCQSVIPLQHSQNRQPGSGDWRLREKPKTQNSPKPTPETLVVSVRLSPDIQRKLEESSQSKELLFPDEGELAVDVSGDMATLKNQRQAIERLEQGRTVNSKVSAWIFNSQKARLATEQPPIFLKDRRLNDGQTRAVTKAMNAPDLFLLQGPPGTGKTTVIAELCRQTTLREKRVLIASQANLAVDNALSSVFPLDCGTPFLRPLRLLDTRREGEMEGEFKRFLLTKVVSTWLNSVAVAAESRLLEIKRSGTDSRWEKTLTRWAQRLKNNPVGDRSERMMQVYKRHANVIGVTCNQSGKKDFYQTTEFNPTFDLVIVDEVSKATPPELLMPLLLGKRSVLVGDHRQLPPMFRSDSFEEAVANGELKAEDLKRFNTLVTASLFEELFLGAPEQIREVLCEQYRMHPHIMDAVNHFYPDKTGKGILLAGGGRESLHKAKQHNLTIRNLRNQSLLKPTESVLWIDSSVDEHGMIVSSEEKRGTSRFNSHEVELIEEFLKHLDNEQTIKNQATKLDVGVISFYLAQTNELRDRLVRDASWSNLSVQVNTVDQFQGRECSIVIVSLVRSGEVSGEFVKDYRRINVAFSRAKQLLVVVGNKRAFDRAIVPVAPVDGGDEKPKKVYQEIANVVTQRGGLRNPSHIFAKAIVYQRPQPITQQKLPTKSTNQWQPKARPQPRPKIKTDDMGLEF